MATPAANGVCSDRRELDEPRRPFPVGVVVLLSLAMTIHSYTLVSLFPYVGLMVKDLLNLETTNQAGFYAGYVASSFTFGRLVSGYPWGYFIDRVGRKPTIIIALLSMAIFSVSFGMSHTYAWALSSRLVLGLTNGIMPALRTSLHEVCGPEHLVVGMTILNSCRAFSMVLGTGIGGVLAQPAIHHPEIFSPTGLFGRYPFLLPNLVGACCAITIMVFIIFVLPETKELAAASKNGHVLLEPSSVNGAKINGDTYEATGAGSHGPSGDAPTISHPAVNGTSKYQELTTSADALAVDPASNTDEIDGGELGGSGSDGGGAMRGERSSSGGGAYELSATDDRTREEGEGDGDDREEEESVGLFGRDGLLAVPNVKTVLFLGCAVQTVQIGFEEAYPLFALSTTDVGGFGWDTVQIGRVFVLTGLLMAVFQLSMFPPIIKLIGLTAWQRIGFTFSAVAFLAVPAVKTVSWNYASLFSASVAANTLVNSGMSAAVLNLSIASTSLVPRRLRGKMGGLFNTAESLGRCLGPAGFAVTYAWSISSTGVAGAHDWINYRFVFYASSAILALCAAIAWRTLTEEELMKGHEQDDAGAGGASGVGGGGVGEDGIVSETTSASPTPSTGSGHGGLGGSEQRGGGISADASFVSGPNGRREADLV